MKASVLAPINVKANRIKGKVAVEDIEDKLLIQTL